jgi:hypothetical protein
LPIPERGEGREEEGVRIARCFVKPGRRGRVEDVLDGGYAGWRVDKEREGEDEREEFVLFSPWEGSKEHLGSTETGGTFAAVEECIDGFEIRHAKVLDLIV